MADVVSRGLRCEGEKMKRNMTYMYINMYMYVATGVQVLAQCIQASYTLYTAYRLMCIKICSTLQRKLHEQCMLVSCSKLSEVFDIELLCMNK